MVCRLTGVKSWVGTLFFSLCLWDIARSQTNGSYDFSTTNRERIQRFWQAMDRSNGPVTLLAFGDSVSDSYRSIQKFVFGDLATKFGAAGYSIGNVDNTLLWILTNGASVSQPTTNWWTAHGLLPSGSSIYWTNQSSPTGSLLCDQVGVFWVAQPGGGAFTLSVSTNGGEWSEPLLSLDGFSSAPAGRYAKLLLSPQPYRMRLDGVSGTNVIIGPQYLLNGSTGVNVTFLAQDGANLDEIFSLSTNVLYPLLSALNPQLVVWHMKELADIGATGLSNRLYDLEDLWRAAVTNGDIVYIGTPYDINDETSVFTPVQNQLVRDAAVRGNHAYVDCMTPCVSYQWMTNNGLLADAIHPSLTCDRFLADIVWQQLGLFALGTDRHLALDFVGAVARLRWVTAANINYELQSSTDMIHWTSLETVAGDGETHVYTNFSPAASSSVFRLSLTQ
jgi:hypothetical protein